jgi:hypothetical protein
MVALVPPVGFTATSGIAVVRIDFPDDPPTLVTTIDPSFLADRSSDGIPTVWDGQPVHRATELAQLVADATDGRSFLIGGWVEGGEGRGCQLQDPTSPTLDPMGQGPVCGGARLSDTPDGRHFYFISSSLLSTGLVVASVHVQMPVVSNCENAVPCRNQLVVDRIEWSGDAWTRTEPRDIAQVVSRLTSGGYGAAVLLDLEVRTYRVVATITMGGMPPNDCDFGVPPQAWVVTNDPRLSLIFVYASVAERERFEPFFTSDGEPSSKKPDGTPCSPIIRSVFESRWVAVDNVMVQVNVGSTASASDVAFLKQVEGRLRGS